MAAFKSFPLYLGKNGICGVSGLLYPLKKKKGRNFLSCKQSRHQHVKKISLMQVAHFIENFTGTEDTSGVSAPLPPPSPKGTRPRPAEGGGLRVTGVNQHKTKLLGDSMI